MRMSIDEAIKRYNSNAFYEKSDGNLQGCLEFRQLAEWLEQYQELKDQYEARLKADMVAMLTELKTEIEKLEPMYMDMISPRQINEVIQQKINELKAESEDKE